MNMATSARLFSAGFLAVLTLAAHGQDRARATPEDASGGAPIHHAAQRGDIEAIRRELANGVDVNLIIQSDRPRKHGLTPLHLAASHADAATVRFLIEHGANVHARNGQESLALILAGAYGDAERLRVLLDAGAEVNARNILGSTALTVAVAYGTLDRVRVLLEAGADPNIPDERVNTPLIYGCRFAQTPIVRALLDAGAKVEPVGEGGLTALSMAAGWNRPDVVAMLLDSGADVNAVAPNGRCAFLAAIEFGHDRVLEVLLERGLQLDQFAQDEFTPLSAAAFFGRAEMVETLLRRGASVTLASPTGRTALLAAVMGGHVEIARRLIEAGAVVDARSEQGATPLMQACGEGAIEMVNLLLDHGAAVNARDKFGSMPLLAAAGSAIDSGAKIVRLLAAGADLHAVNTSRQGAVHAAAWSGNVEALKALALAGADLASRDKAGYGVLHWASHGGHAATIEHLLTIVKSDLERTTDEGLTPLMIASREGRDEAIGVLLAAGANIETRDPRGRTPLMHAAARAGVATVARLLEAGADRDAEDSQGWTALDYAGARKDQASDAVVELLGRAEAAPPDPTPAEALHALAMQGQQPGENGWPHLHQAGEIARNALRGLKDEGGWPESWFGWPDAGELLRREPTDAERAAARRILDRFAADGVFDHLSKARAAANVVVPIDMSNPSRAIDAWSGLLGTREVTRALMARFALALEAGDADEAINSIDQLRWLHRVISEQPSVVPRILAYAAIDLNALQHFVTEGRITPALARRLRAVIEQVEPAPSEKVIRGEHILQAELVRFVYDDARRNDGMTTDEFLREALRMSLRFHDALEGFLRMDDGAERAPDLPDPDEFEATVEATVEAYVPPTMEETLEQLEMSFRAVLDWVDKAEATGDPLTPDMRDRLKALGPRLFMVEDAAGAVLSTIRSEAGFRRGRNALIIMLALEEHRAAAGAYPETLEALTPGVLPTVPLDAASNRPFRYRRLDPDADPLGRGYTLYVPGADGTDDGGRWNPENPHAATDPVKGRGFDLVFNLPRGATR